MSTMRSKVSLVFTLLVLSAAVRADAQTECELRIGSAGIGGSLSLPLAHADVDYGRLDGGLWSEVSARDGRAWSAEVSLPIMPGWGGRIDYSRGHLAVERRVTAADFFDVVERTRVGSVTVRHVTGSVVHAVSPPGRLCAYTGGGLGIYEFDYAGQRARNRGLFGLAGIEVPVGERSGLGLEIQLHAAHNNYEGALRSETVLMLKPTATFRVRF